MSQPLPLRGGPKRRYGATAAGAFQRTLKGCTLPTLHLTALMGKLPDVADIVLTTLNAKYIHAAFGLRYLLANLGDL